MTNRAEFTTKAIEEMMLSSFSRGAVTAIIDKFNDEKHRAEIIQEMVNIALILTSEQKNLHQRMGMLPIIVSSSLKEEKASVARQAGIDLNEIIISDQNHFNGLTKIRSIVDQYLEDPQSFDLEKAVIEAIAAVAKTRSSRVG